MWRAWKNFYRNKSARPYLARRTIATRLNCSRLSRDRTRKDAVVIHTNQKNGIRIHGVGSEFKRRRRRECSCQRQGVWTSAWRSDGERAAELNIEELLPRSEFVEIHDAAGVIPRGRGQLQLADEAFFIARSARDNHAAPDEGKVSRQTGGRDGAGRFGKECC